MRDQPENVCVGGSHVVDFKRDIPYHGNRILDLRIWQRKSVRAMVRDCYFLIYLNPLTSQSPRTREREKTGTEVINILFCRDR